MEKYLVISHDIAKKIRDEQYAVGTKLPSINELAQQYACSRGTVIRAYRQLLEQNLVHVRHKSGYYSSYSPTIEEKATGYHLESGNPTVGSFHLPFAKQSLALALDHYQLESLDVGANGVSSVIAALTTSLEDVAVYTEADHVFLTMGIQQTVHALCKMTFPSGHHAILIEEPTYRFVIEALQAQPDLTIYTIKRDENGIDLTELERLFKEKSIKFFYLVPRNHNPLGTTLSLKQRKKIVALAQKYQVYLAEDDYFLDAYKTANYTPLYYLAAGKNCIYLGSFTKILPYLRIGFTILPPELQAYYMDTVNEIMHLHYYTPPLISQSMLGVLIYNQFLDKSKQMIDQDLKKKLKKIKSLTKNWDPNIAFYTGYEGYYATIRIHPSIPVTTIIKALAYKQIYVVSNQCNFFDSTHFDNSIRVSLAKISVSDIEIVYPELYATIASFAK